MIALDKQIDVDSQQVLSNIGYDIDCQPPSRIESLVNEYAENVRHLIEPSYSCVIRDIEWTQASISFIEGSVIFKSRVVAQLLERLTKDKNVGYVANTGEFVHMVRAGIVDPAKVARIALEMAASVSGLMLTTQVLVTGGLERIHDGQAGFLPHLDL